MEQYRYILEKGSKKHLCPECSKRRFVRYFDTEKNEYLPEHYGRCDREGKCNYHLNPYSDGYAKALSEQDKSDRSKLPNTWKRKPKPKPPESVFIPLEVLRETLQPERYEQNVFIQNLLNRVAFPFDIKDVERVVSLYYLGTVSNGYRKGAITFPFIDLKGNIRAVQVKQFDETNHTTGTDFLHSIIEKHHTRNNKPLPEWLEAYTKQEKRVSCLFGEHLLKDYPLNPIALVEAPKTAVYCSLYFGFPEQPENFIWLAVYNKSSFSFDKLSVLKGRDVYTFPDLSQGGNTFNEWKQKAQNFENRLPGTKFIFSDLLEKLAPETDKQKGSDIADYLIKLDWRSFRKKQQIPEPQPESVQAEPLNREKCEKCEPEKKHYFNEVEKPPVQNSLKAFQKLEVFEPIIIENWEAEIMELETFFYTTTLPKTPICLDKQGTIFDLEKYIDCNLNTAKANNGKRTFLPYLNRLQALKQLLTLN
jgi:hypothetical protein